MKALLITALVLATAVVAAAAYATYLSKDGEITGPEASH